MKSKVGVQNVLDRLKTVHTREEIYPRFVKYKSSNSLEAKFYSNCAPVFKEFQAKLGNLPLQLRFQIYPLCRSPIWDGDLGLVSSCCWIWDRLWDRDKTKDDNSMLYTVLLFLG